MATKKHVLSSKTNQYAFVMPLALLALPGGRELVCQNLEYFLLGNGALTIFFRTFRSNLTVKGSGANGGK